MAHLNKKLNKIEKENILFEEDVALTTDTNNQSQILQKVKKNLEQKFRSEIITEALPTASNFFKFKNNFFKNRILNDDSETETLNNDVNEINSFNSNKIILDENTFKFNQDDLSLNTENKTSKQILLESKNISNVYSDYWTFNSDDQLYLNFKITEI